MSAEERVLSLIAEWKTCNHLNMRTPKRRKTTGITSEILNLICDQIDDVEDFIPQICKSYLMTCT